MPETVSITGNVGGTPQVHMTPNEKPDTQFSVGLYAGKDKDGNNLTTWVRIHTWGKTGEVALKKIKKGDRVRLTGILHNPNIYSSKKSGEEKASLELTAFHIYRVVHDVRYEEEDGEVVAE